MPSRHLVVLALVTMLTVSACGGDDESDGQALTMWSSEAQTERVAATEEILARFTDETGITVNLVPVGEDAFSETMVGAAASGDMPEVIFHPVDFTSGWVAQGLLDTDAAASVVESLGIDTFAEGAIELVTIDGAPAVVPSDGWGQLLLYRTDLFEQAGLDPPDTYERLEAAAKALHDPSNDLNGITAATSAGAVFTQQTYEQFALANGCQLTDGDEIALDSDECTASLQGCCSNPSPDAPGSPPR